jgi:hypothetical protein
LTIKNKFSRRLAILLIIARSYKNASDQGNVQKESVTIFSQTLSPGPKNLAKNAGASIQG